MLINVNTITINILRDGKPSLNIKIEINLIKYILYIKVYCIMSSSQVYENKIYSINDLRRENSSQDIAFMSPQAQELIGSLNANILYQFEQYCPDTVFNTPAWSLVLSAIIDGEEKKLEYYRFNEESYEHYSHQNRQVCMTEYAKLTLPAQKIVDELATTGLITLHFEEIEQRYVGDEYSESENTLYVFVKPNKHEPANKYKYKYKCTRSLKESIKTFIEIVKYTPVPYTEEDDDFIKPIMRKVC